MAAAVTPERAHELVVAARNGDRAAWAELVDGYTPLLWSIARANGLHPDVAADVVQTAWLRLAEHLDRIEQPDRLSAWLITTVRREAFRTSKRKHRERLVASFHGPDELDGEILDAELPVITADEVRRLWASLDELPALCQALLRTLMTDPPPSYAEVGEALEMPIGSIGPRRARCLERLRKVFDPPYQEPSY